jgi:predicted ArsR family transcriptional regulator
MTKASYILTKHLREAVVEMLRRGQAIVGELARELKLSRQGVQHGLNGEIAKRRADYVHKLWKEASK